MHEPGMMYIHQEDARGPGSMYFGQKLTECVAREGCERPAPRLPSGSIYTSYAAGREPGPPRGGGLRGWRNLNLGGPSVTWGKRGKLGGDLEKS